MTINNKKKVEKMINDIKPKTSMSFDEVVKGYRENKEKCSDEFREELYGVHETKKEDMYENVVNDLCDEISPLFRNEVMGKRKENQYGIIDYICNDKFTSNNYKSNIESLEEKDVYNGIERFKKDYLIDLKSRKIQLLEKLQEINEYQNSLELVDTNTIINRISSVVKKGSNYLSNLIGNELIPISYDRDDIQVVNTQTRSNYNYSRTIQMDGKDVIKSLENNPTFVLDKMRDKRKSSIQSKVERIVGLKEEIINSKNELENVEETINNIKNKGFVPVRFIDDYSSPSIVYGSPSILEGISDEN